MNDAGVDVRWNLKFRSYPDVNALGMSYHGPQAPTAMCPTGFRHACRPDR